ncbi:MauE/DoxX family redox-associated membrane protein [Flavobacterium pectinovorum]|uniref:Methylamine utilisation protein MauE n=1 Tax=Flavobacterium pectinovorum TaxID=29533 RepID=A0AB36P624_9FLAO|nr:hypothetical protein B0A72_02810 [Flavobacterium pectinovorum]SHM81337.1 Methylamine utilisation protein MauE [Flavobacterium pectinovorum]
MKLSAAHKIIIVEIISCLYILLFVYAAVNKFIDFEGFQVQLAQSPLLSSFAGPISWLIPVSEVIIAGLLFSQKTRLTGLYLSFCLMVMFSIYIVIILNFSPFVPCSCGGILEKLGWKEHLLFNIAFCLIAIPGILYQSMLNPKQSTNVPSIKMAVLTVAGTATMCTLFLISEDMIHHRNNFTRRFYGTPAEFVKDFELESKSYIAGVGNGKVYICDNRDPLKVFEFDQDLKTVITRTITTNEPNRRFKSLRVAVNPPYFYVYDGHEAFTFSGNIADWKAEIWIDKLAYYNFFVPIDSSHAAIRAISADENESIIGIMQRTKGGNSLNLNKKLLDKQIDGFFDTDGKLLFNKKYQKLIYVYYYRNEYLITNTSLSEKNTGHTIDTTSKAKIKVAYVKRLKARKIASPMRIVNKVSATNGDFLYINSNLIGQFEEKSMWEEASIVDVYNILDKSYMFSFYLYDKKGIKVDEFVLGNDKIYTLAGRILTVYDFDATPYKKKK